MTGSRADETLEITLGRVLGVGVTLSSMTLAVGLVSALVLGASGITDGLLTAGVMILIATPVARVVISSLAFLRRRDWTFAVLTLIVLGELVASIIAALRGRP